MKLKGGLAMITQKDFLRFAFEEAINEVNPNSIERDVVKPIIKTGMQEQLKQGLQNLTLRKRISGIDS